MKNSTTFIAFITALALHLILGAVLLMGVDFDMFKDKPKQEVAIINASMVNQQLFDNLAQKKAQQKADKLAAKKRKEDKIRKEKARVEREKKREETRRKKAEAKRIKAEKEKIERKKKEEERILFEKIVAAKELRAKKAAAEAKKLADAQRKKEEAKRIKQQAEAKRIEAEKYAAAQILKEKQAKEAKIQAEKEAKLKAEKEAKLKAEKEAKLKAEKERQRKADEAERLRQEELDRQMEAEFEDAFSSAQNAKQQSEIARYKALIQDKISRNWQVEPNMKGKSCTLAIRLASDGLVISANRSKGDQKLCDSAKRATLRAKTLPIPKDPEIAPQFRDFDITLEPDL